MGWEAKAGWCNVCDIFATGARGGVEWGVDPLRLSKLYLNGQEYTKAKVRQEDDNIKRVLGRTKGFKAGGEWRGGVCMRARQGREGGVRHLSIPAC